MSDVIYGYTIKVDKFYLLTYGRECEKGTSIHLWGLSYACVAFPQNGVYSYFNFKRGQVLNYQSLEPGANGQYIIERWTCLNAYNIGQITQMTTFEIEYGIDEQFLNSKVAYYYAKDKMVIEGELKPIIEMPGSTWTLKWPIDCDI